MASFQTPEDPVDENENIRQLLAQFHQCEQPRLDGAKTKLRAEVIPKLLKHRVANVEVAYSGCGDSGAIDGTQFRDTTGQRVDRASLPPDVIEDLGRFPTIQDWLGRIQPEPWMLGKGREQVSE